MKVFDYLLLAYALWRGAIWLGTVASTRNAILRDMYPEKVGKIYRNRFLLFIVPTGILLVRIFGFDNIF
jgi:hypothetical protein